VATARSSDIGEIGVLPDEMPLVRSTIKGDPADRAGVKPGDVVIAINGERIGFPAQVSDAISRNAGHEIDLTCDARSAAAHRGHSGAARRSAGTQSGMIGVSLGEATKSFKPGPFEAIKLSVDRNVDNSGLIFRTLTGLFTGETSVGNCRDRSGSRSSPANRHRLDCSLLCR
jgi:regulator of sigma E protease